jgi:hypothetical protein
MLQDSWWLDFELRSVSEKINKKPKHNTHSVTYIHHVQHRWLVEGSVRKINPFCSARGALGVDGDVLAAMLIRKLNEIEYYSVLDLNTKIDS